MAVDRAVAEEGRSFWSAAILCRFGVWRARTRILRSWQKRQRTAALQDAGATQSAPCGVREVLECVWLATAFRPPDEATNLGAVRPLALSPSRPLPAKAAAPLRLRRTHSKTLSRPSRPRAESARSWSACGLPPLFVRRTWQQTSGPFDRSTSRPLVLSPPKRQLRFCFAARTPRRCRDPAGPVGSPRGLGVRVACHRFSSAGRGNELLGRWPSGPLDRSLPKRQLRFCFAARTPRRWRDPAVPQTQPALVESVTTRRQARIHPLPGPVRS